MKNIADLFESLPDDIANNIVIDDAPPLDYESVMAFGRYGYHVLYKPNSGIGGNRENTRPSSPEERRSLQHLGSFRVSPSYVGGGCEYSFNGKQQRPAHDAREAVINIWNGTRK
jgi:hypothetical protein